MFAPPLLLATMAFSFAVSIGTLWEIFEFGMDILFGLSMQKSGVIDMMGDLIVDAIGAGAGYWYLKRGGTKFLPLTIVKWTPRRTGFWGQYRGEFYSRLSGQAS